MRGKTLPSGQGSQATRKRPKPKTVPHRKAPAKRIPRTPGQQEGAHGRHHQLHHGDHTERPPEGQDVGGQAEGGEDGRLHVAQVRRSAHDVGVPQRDVGKLGPRVLQVGLEDGGRVDQLRVGPDDQRVDAVADDARRGWPCSRAPHSTGSRRPRWCGRAAGPGRRRSRPGRCRQPRATSDGRARALTSNPARTLPAHKGRQVTDGRSATSFIGSSLRPPVLQYIAPRDGPRAYAEMYDVEERHWWFRGRRAVIWALLSLTDLPAKPRFLDAGCGTGRHLIEFGSLGPAVGVDPSADAVAFCHQRGLDDVQLRRPRGSPFRRRLPSTCCWPATSSSTSTTTSVPWSSCAGWRPTTRHPSSPSPPTSGCGPNTTSSSTTSVATPCPSCSTGCRSAGWDVERSTYFNSFLLPGVAAARLAGPVVEASGPHRSRPHPGAPERRPRASDEARGGPDQARAALPGRRLAGPCLSESGVKDQVDGTV